MAEVFRFTNRILGAETRKAGDVLPREVLSVLHNYDVNGLLHMEPGDYVYTGESSFCDELS